jgi:replication factor A3
MTIPSTRSLRVFPPLNLSPPPFLTPNQTTTTPNKHIPPQQQNKMADTLSTPRILAPHLDSFTSRTIRLIGRVTQLRGEQASIDAQGNVTAILNRDCHLSVGHAVEIVGKVNGDLSVKVLQATDMGDGKEFGKFDLILEFGVGEG